MIENNYYLIGLATCTKISLGIWIILCIFILIKNFTDNDNSENYLDKIYLTIFFFFVLGLGVFISSFLVIYPLYNLFLQDFLDLGFYQKEISQGALQLRFTSLLLGFNFLKSMYNFVADRLLANQKKLIADYPDLQKIEPRMNEYNINVIILTQNLIYGAVTLLLWIFIFLSKSLLELRLVTWGLFFIIDDWAIISDNFIALKGRILKSHKLRIIFFNALLFSLIVTACFRELNNILLSIFITLTFCGLVLLNTTSLFSNDRNE